MRDVDKTKEQLIDELGQMRQRITQLEAVETERKQTEIPLPGSDEYRRLFELSPMGIIVLDMKGVITACNPVVCVKSGYSKNDFIGKHFSKVSTIRARDIPKFMKIFASLIRGKVPQPLEVTYTRKDGTTGWTEAHISLMKSSGKRIGIQVIQNDITERKQAEEELRESEERYRALVNLGGSVGEAIIMLQDKDGVDAVHIFVSNEWPSITGYSREELLGMSFYDLLHPRYRESSLNRHKRKLSGEIIPELFEMSIIRKDDAEVPIETTSAYTTYKGKRANVAFIRDITERKRAEEALRESEERFRIASQIASDVVYERDLQTGIATFYGDIASHLGYEPGEFPRTMEGWRENIHPEDLAWIDRQSIDQLEPGVLHSIEYRMRKKDGTYMTWWDRVMLIKDEETGKPIKFIGAATDITERKQAEESLREREEKLQLMFESVTDGITVTDLNGIITDTNKRTLEIHGFGSREEIVGKSAFEFIALRDHERARTNMQRTSDKGVVSNLEYTLLKADGSEFPGELGASTLTDNAGKPAGFIAITRNITERKQAEEREKELQQELNLSSRLASVGELAAGVAHEINNPLTGIMGFSERLLRKSTDEETSQGLEKIHSEAQRAARIVESLRTFARRSEPKKEYLDINDILGRTLELRAYQLRTGNVELAVELAPDLPEIFGDFGQIQQVFLNIILNSEQAITEANSGGKLTIKTQKEKDCIRISFADDGPGIPAEHLSKVFDPFFTTRGERDGTGLGLSACHGIVTEHGGKIYVKSKPGKGATFFVELPATARETGE